MTDLRAYAFLCWALSALGIAMFYDARSVSPGGIVPHSMPWVVVSLVLASLFGCAAVGLHVAELVAKMKSSKKGEADGTCE